MGWNSAVNKSEIMKCEGTCMELENITWVVTQMQKYKHHTFFFSSVVSRYKSGSM